MNARQPIQPSDQPPVLAVAFSTNSHRFIAGLTTGIRSFRTDNCLTTNQPELPRSGGVAVVAQHDDRYMAYVAGGRTPAGKTTEVIFWDAERDCEVQRYDFHEEVLGLRLNETWMVVILRERTIVFRYQELPPAKLPMTSPDEADAAEEIVTKGPNIVHALYPTASNDHALASLRTNTLVLPATTPGQVQLIPLEGGSKRVVRAHDSSIRALTLSSDGTALATASEQGTLFRIYSTSTLSQLHEVRRGTDKADIFDLALSPKNKWLAATSDKGTLHLFDLRPAAVLDEEGQVIGYSRPSSSSHRKSNSYATPHHHRLSAGNPPSSNSSGPNSAPTATGTAATNQGSVQEYYSLRPVPPSASSPPARVGISAIAALKASPFAPKVFKDIRSVASAAFFMGEETEAWQGGVVPRTTKAVKVRVSAPALPGTPSGRPPRGTLAFDGAFADGNEDEGARVYVIGGGLEARWEVFDVVQTEGQFGLGWALVKRGFRRFLERQFVD
ncbi:hypothetical protein LTR62_006492 [Meristemomyces frigidus]|uniref:WD40 repeat-like protein n=1 Tax=Meristemomyces frigidus TaxID=1508187 RepID=A0AAN7YPV7_9PEZI|nr:hypothetical protein LTR62_006492 [Meristemomyces frigidus]